MNEDKRKDFLDFIIDRGLLTGRSADAVRMLKESRFFFGVLALRERMITLEQLEEALSIQLSQKDNKQKIGEIMVSRGFLTENQVEAVLERKTVAAEHQAALLLDIGMMDEDEVESALNAYKEAT